MDFEIFKEKILKLYPSYTSVLGPYKRKDGREHIVLNNNNLKKGDKNKLKTISYPKAIMEVHLNRKLLENETVDHIDRNPLNNNLDNLQVLDRNLHSKIDVIRVKYEMVECYWCGEKFYPTTDQVNSEANGFFCSKYCTGKYGAAIQNGKIEKAPKKDIKKFYYQIDKLK